MTFTQWQHTSKRKTSEWP